MGDGKITRFALIINGDVEPRHLQNVEMALGVLKASGYQSYVASPRSPQQRADHYFAATPKKVKELVTQLKDKIDNDDELVVYTTGHGGIIREDAHLCVKTKCDTNLLPPSLINELTFGSRTIVMDQCMGGSWGKNFLQNARTLFIAAGSRKEEVCCTEFAPQFWSKSVPDLNRDGGISFQERYAHVMTSGVSRSVPQFVPSKGYPFEGKPPFSTQVDTFSTKNGLQKAVSRLKPGQYALVTYSTSWCTSCKTFKPRFEQFAKEAGGHMLFLRTEDEALALSLGFTSFPTVVAYNHLGQHVVIKKRDDLFLELAQFHVSDAILTIRKMERKIQESMGTNAMKHSQLMFQLQDDCKKIVSGRILSTLSTPFKGILRTITGYPVEIFDDSARIEEQTALSNFLQKYQDAIGNVENTGQRLELQIALGNIMHSLGFDKMTPSLYAAATRGIDLLTDTNKKAMFRTGIARGQLTNGDKPGATATINTLLKENSSTTDKVIHTWAIHTAALLSHQMGDFKKSEILFKQAIHAAESINDKTLWSDLAINLAKAERQALALKCFLKIEVAEDSSDLFSDRASGLTVLAKSMRTNGFPDESQRIFDKAVNTANKIPNPTSRLFSLVDLAKILGASQSEGIFKHAIIAADFHPVPEKRIESMNRVILAMPSVSTSIPLLKDIDRRIAKYPEGVDRTKLALDVAEDMGRLGQDVSPRLMGLLKEVSSIPNLHTRILLLARIAREFKRCHHHELAETTFNQAIQICKKMEGSSKISTLTTLADDMFKINHREGALKAYREALAVAESENNHALKMQINTLMMQRGLISDE